VAGGAAGVTVELFAFGKELWRDRGWLAGVANVVGFWFIEEVA